MRYDLNHEGWISRMTRLSPSVAALALAGALVLAGPALSLAQTARFQVAQSYSVPPDNVSGGDSQDTGGGSAPQGGSDSASLLLRVERLEDQIRQMTGEIQQMQFQNRQLQDQLKKFQEDVDFRFQERGGRPARHSELAPAPPVATGTVNAPVPSDTAGAETLADTGGASAPRAGRDDAFDPTAHPDAPGAPKPLGAGESAPPVAGASGGGSDPNAPLNLPSAQYTPAPASGASVPAGGVTSPGGTMIASAQPPSPRQEFDVALGYFKQKDYDNAQRGFAAFVDKNPKSRLTAEALYFLGESYAARGRTREAAEQFLKISTNYTASARAPEAMLRLGVSLRALGAKEQACATFSEVPRKYPNASAAVKAGAEREAKRSQCGA
jgi:tol-pal system protein YbgF